MINSNQKKIFICATEQSGDNIGAQIIKELLKTNLLLSFEGVGGSQMKPFFTKQIYSINEFKSMGIFEIIFSIKKYIKMIATLSNIVLKKNYDLIITIDSPDFNYPLVKKIKKQGYKNKIIQIVAPTVWAWRKYRAKRFAKVYDEILTLFNFENQYFEKYNLKSTFIGHPIYYINNTNNSNEEKILIAFLPGSRLGEVNTLIPFFNIAHDRLLSLNTNLKIFIPTLPHLENIILNYTKYWKIETIITSDLNDIDYYFQNTKFALVCSGTASLEVAKRLIPQLIIYKFNYFTELLVKNFVKVNFANILNIIEDKMIIPELTNTKLTISNFKNLFDKLIIDKDSNKKQVRRIKEILKKVETSKPPFKLAAERIISYL